MPVFKISGIYYGSAFIQLLPDCWYNPILGIDKQKRQLLYFGKKNPQITLFHSLTKDKVNKRENAILDS